MTLITITMRNLRTGTYHKGYEGGSATFCNGRSMRAAKATESDIKAADSKHFCAKCFPNGKPN